MYQFEKHGGLDTCLSICIQGSGLRDFSFLPIVLTIFNGAELVCIVPPFGMQNSVG